MALLSLPRRLVWICCLCAAAALSSAAYGEAPAFDYDIDLDVPQAERALLTDHLDIYRWRSNARMDEAQLRYLVRAAPDQIREFLSTEGFYSPKIQATLDNQAGRWRVRLSVDPGQPVRVSRFDLAVKGAFDDGSSGARSRLDTMRKDWPLRPGDVFRHADWEAAKRNVLTALLLDRYPTAAIETSRADVDPDKRSVDLQLTLDSGPAFTFGELEIHGLKRYPATLVERLNPIKPGEPYAQGKLLQLQSRLQDSAYFASAEVNVETDPTHSDGVPVKVDVKENPARKLGLGVGISTDAGPRGQVDYQDLDLLGRTLRLSSTLKLDNKNQSLGGEIRFLPTEAGYYDSLSAQLDRSDIEGEVTRTLALGAKRSRVRGKEETSYGLRYYLEQQDVSQAQGDRRSALIPSLSWTRRDVDSLLYPRRGIVLKFETDMAARALLSDRDFLRGYGKVVWFRPLGERDQIIVRGEFGAVLATSRDGIPSDFLFRTGGDQSVRGYAYQSLGVRDGDAIVGGRYLAVASAEYVHWLTPQWGAALFYDVGDAADHPADLAPVQGYGAGVRWKSPIGPLNFDVAYGQKTGNVRLHFSVGFNL